jgi:hypothetical protein
MDDGKVDLLLLFPELIAARFVTSTLFDIVLHPRVSRIWSKVGMRSEYARELLINNFLEESGSEWLWIVDTDMEVPRGALDRLLSHNKKVVSAMYFSRGDHTWPIPFQMEPIHHWPKTRMFNYPKNALVEAGATGHGCLLLHRTVLEKLEPPYSRLGPFGDEPVVGSDVRLCLKIREEANEKIWIDTGLQCGHLSVKPITESDWLDVKDWSIIQWEKYLKESS